MPGRARHPDPGRCGRDMACGSCGRSPMRSLRPAVRRALRSPLCSAGRTHFPRLTQGDIITAVTDLSVSVSVEDGDGSRTVVRLVGEADVTTRALGEVLGAEAAK